MRFVVKLTVLLISILSLSNCVGIPPAPRMDVGILRVQDLGDKKFKVEGLFENDKGTEFKIDASKLDKYLVIHPQQALDMIAWMNKVMVILKAELYKK